MEPEKEQGLVFDTDETRETSKGKAGSGVFRYGAVALLFILALAAVFYFMDPMGLFGEEASPEPSGDIAGTDTTEIIRPDTSANLQEDTLAAVPDTLQVIDPPAQDEDPYGLASLVLDDEYSAIENPAPVDFRRSAPASVRASVLREESDIIADPVFCEAVGPDECCDAGAGYPDASSASVTVRVKTESETFYVLVMNEKIQVYGYEDDTVVSALETWMG